MNLKNINLKFIIFAIFLIIGVVGFHFYPNDVAVRKNLSVVTSDGVKLCFDVYEPKNNNSLNKKAIIVGHGVMINKEVMRLIAVELAHLDFVVVAFDFRGHGLSGGDFNFIAENFDLNKMQLGDDSALSDVFNFEILKIDIETIKNAYLAKRGDIDMHNLGYIGYSMGGGAGFVALSSDNDFAAMVGLCPSPEYNYVNSTNPKNILVLASKYDEAISIQSIINVMKNKTGVDSVYIYNNITKNPDHSWTFENGNVSEGSAARLYYHPYLEHFLAGWDYIYIKEIRNWMTYCLYNTQNLNSAETIPMVYPYLVTFYIMQSLCAVAILIYIIIFITSKIKINSQKEKKEKLFPEEFLKQNPIMKSLAKALIYIVPLSFPCMLLFIPFYLLPLLITDFQLMLMFGPSVAILFFILNCLKIAYKAENIDHKNKIGLKFLYGKILSMSSRRNILIGFLIGFIYYFTIYLTIGQLFSIMPSLYDWIWVPFYMIITIFIYSNFIILFQADVQEKINLKSKSQIKVEIKTILVNFALNILFSIFILFTPSILLGNYFIAMFIIAVVFLHLLSALIATITYSRTGDLLMTIIATSILPCLMFSTLSPYIWIGSFI